MRISDGSSDVCSSDLRTMLMGASALATTPTWSGALTATAKPGNDPYLHPGGVRTLGEFDYDQVALLDGPALNQREMTMAVLHPVPEGERESLVEGKRASVRRDHGGQRSIK